MDFSWGLWAVVGSIVLVGGWMWWMLRPDTQEDIREQGRWTDQEAQMARLQEKVDVPLSHRDRNERARRFGGAGAPCNDGGADIADVVVPLIIVDQMFNTPAAEESVMPTREELPPHSHDESPWTHVEYGTDSSSHSSDSSSSGGGYDSGGSSDGGSCGGGD